MATTIPDPTSQAIINAANNVNTAAPNSSALSQATATLQGLVETTSGGQTVANPVAVQDIQNMTAAQQAAVNQAMLTATNQATSSSQLTAAEQAVVNQGAPQGISGLQFNAAAAATAATATAATATAAASTPPPPAKSSPIDTAVSVAGTIAGILPTVAKLGGMSSMSSFLSGPYMVDIAMVLNAYNMYSAFSSMFSNGFSWGSLGKLAMAFGSEVISLVQFGIPLPLAALAAAAVMVATLVVAFITWLFGRKPNAAEQQIANFDNLTVYSSNQVLMLASASAFMLMGYNIDNAMTSLNASGIPIPTSTLTQLLTNNLTNADGSTYSGGLPYGVPIVLKGAGAGGGDEVMIVSQKGIQNGKATDSMQTYDLANNMAFTKPTDTSLAGAYIPFFGPDGKVNPQAVTAVNSQRAILQSTPNLAAASQTNGVAVAGAADKQGVQATSIP